MYVKINHNVINNKIRENKSYVQDLEVSINKISDMVLEINDVWDDETYIQFQTKMNELIDELNEYKEQINSYNHFIEGYININEDVNNCYYDKKIDIE